MVSGAKGIKTRKLTLRARVSNDPANNNIASVFTFENARLRVSESPVLFYSLFIPSFTSLLDFVRLLYFLPLYLNFYVEVTNE